MKASCTTSFIGLVPKTMRLTSTGFHHRRRADADAARVPPGQPVVNDFLVLSAGSGAERAGPSCSFPGHAVWAFVHLVLLPGFRNRPTNLLRRIRSFIGRGRTERELSVMHTGGDLGLPAQARAAVEP